MRGDLRAQALRSRGDLPSYLLQGDPLSGCARVSSKIQGDGGWGAGGVYVRERRNRDRDNRRLWGDLRRSRPSRKEESEWTMIAPATSTLNVGEVESLFTEVPTCFTPARSSVVCSRYASRASVTQGSLAKSLPPFLCR